MRDMNGWKKQSDKNYSSKSENKADKSANAISVNDIIDSYNHKNSADGAAVLSNAGSVPSQKPIEEEFSEFAKVSVPRRIIDRILYTLSGMVPIAGDHPLEFIRKILFVLALTTLIVSSTYIFRDTVVMPAITKSVYGDVARNYERGKVVGEIPENFTGSFPAGMLDSLKATYAKNPDTRGYLSYKLNNGENSKYKDIYLPVMYSKDNNYYLHHDFNRSSNAYGALFFDKQNRVDQPEDNDKVLIIHGHNMNNGAMLSGLNEFMKKDLAIMRRATIMDLDTLYEERTYEVFSVMLSDVDGNDYFDYLRSSFSDEGYLKFIDELRLRSIYNFPYVKVGVEDELLILSTCSDENDAFGKGRGVKLKNGRTVVIAKRVDKSHTTSDAELKQISINNNALMPYAWYVNNKKELHPSLVN